MNDGVTIKVPEWLMKKGYIRPLSSFFCDIIVKQLEAKTNNDHLKCTLDIMNYIVFEEDFLETMNKIGYKIFEKFVEDVHSLSDDILQSFCF